MASGRTDEHGTLLIVIIRLLLNLHRRLEVMKVNESEVKLNGGRCDFCQVEEAKFSINGGLWWICEKCMNDQFRSEEE